MVLYPATPVPATYTQQMAQYGYEDMSYFSDDNEILRDSSFEPLEVNLPGQTFVESNQGSGIPNSGPSQTETPSTGRDHTPDSSDPKLIIMPDKDLRITQVANTASEHIAALRLVADSVAQQRQIAARAILFNPFFWPLVPLVPVVIYYYPYKASIDQLTLIFVTVGVLIAFGSIVRWSVAGYFDAAEKVGTWRWLYGLEEQTQKKVRRHNTLDLTLRDCRCRHVRPREGPQKRDIVLVARLVPSGEIIGTIILRVTPFTLSSKTSSQSNSSEKRCLETPAPVPNCKAIVRAWTVKQSHRGAGIGAWMLKDAILICLKYGWMGPEFAKDHANSVRVLPRRLNGWLDQMEARAERRLSRDIATLSSTPEGIDGWAASGVL